MEKNDKSLCVYSFAWEKKSLILADLKLNKTKLNFQVLALDVHSCDPLP